MLLIPIPLLSQGTYIDENALQPAQVNTYWNWGDVHTADLHMYQLDGIVDRNLTSEQRAEFFRMEFSKLGLAASTQNYTFTTSKGTISGNNAYAVMSSPRAAGTEAMVISASWLSTAGHGALNVRGISTVLSLAAFLKDYSLWAKDIIFVISDDYLHGMHAWLNAYHGTIPSNLHTDPLEHISGVIWTALNIDYSGHSFSHLGVFHEGLNGRLPNQDLINSFRFISHYTGGLPMTVYDHLEPADLVDRWSEWSVLPSWTPAFIRRSPQLQQYEYRARNVVRHIGYQARGMCSGVHGLFHQFRIDAITIFAVPAKGPHGFHALGKIVESTLRTMNNLLERLHASFFFYILTSPGTFLKIGMFLPSAILVSVAMLFKGLGEWVDAGWVREVSEVSLKGTGSLEKEPKTKDTWRNRRRPMLSVLITMVATHVLGVLVFNLLCSRRFDENRSFFVPAILAAVSMIPPALLPLLPKNTPEVAPSSVLLKSSNLCLASTVISIMSLLNFSLAAMLALTMGVPLATSSRSSSMTTSLLRYAAYCILAWGWLVLLPEEVESAIWNWEVLGVWFAPFVCIVYAPLVMQAGIVCLQGSS
ncbi:Gaa1-like GPI transamidase component [Rhizopogon vinicolor AM-OR11-026]|uniref:Gaa1-like GPI transamidase component n=1 Tax=Rhizopogon vinicolor AM-OR11-026 TaxID=1314800 RepID=A0A1B7MVM8_9AGAM|nr:Gaa1-like GPI transamidase component [Rhizopogon vinicolor AM-OR11-026]